MLDSKNELVPYPRGAPIEPNEPAVNSIMEIPDNRMTFPVKAPISKSKKRRSRKDLCKIRDKDRDLRRMSRAPDVGFIVEEGLLEDLCELAGEEAHDGGTIIL